MLHGSCASLPAVIVMLKMGETKDGRSSLVDDDDSDGKEGEDDNEDG